MSFGVKITNGNDETVIDGTNPMLVLSGTRTVNGSLRTVKDGSQNYLYSIPSTAVLSFVQIPVGTTVAVTSNGLVSDAGTLSFRDTKLVSVVSRPTSGYGMMILDPSGNVNFLDTEGMMGISEVLQLPADGSTIACDKSWYALPMMQQYAQGNTVNTPYYGEGIKRVDASNVQMRMLSSIVSGTINYTTWTDSYANNPNIHPLDYYVLAGLT